MKTTSRKPAGTVTLLFSDIVSPAHRYSSRCQSCLDGAARRADVGGYGSSWLVFKQVFSGCQMISLNQSQDKIVAGGVLGVLLSVDEGEHWNWIHQAGAAHNTALINDRIIIMNISGDLFMSDDWGKNWHLGNYFPKAGSYVYETVKVDQYLVLSNNYGIHRSNDAGKTWENIYKTEALVFLDLIAIGNTVYGGKAGWGERRGKSK